jgi:plastocyanin
MTFLRSGRKVAGLTAAVLLVVLLAVSSSATAIPLRAASPATTSASASSVTIDVTATSDISFVPNSFTVSPGESVTLVVTQGANFAHTFTLSSVVNFTIPSSDTTAQLDQFLAAHPPLVNLSLGTSAGAQFTAPAAQGTYEFVCLVHFPAMTGVMTDSSSTPSSGGSTVSTTEIVVIGAVVAVVAIAAVVLALRRGRRPPT